MNGPLTFINDLATSLRCGHFRLQLCACYNHRGRRGVEFWLYSVSKILWAVKREIVNSDLLIQCVQSAGIVQVRNFGKIRCVWCYQCSFGSDETYCAWLCNHLSLKASKLNVRKASP